MISSKSSIKDVLLNIRGSDAFLRKIGIDVNSNKENRLSSVLIEKNIDVKPTLTTLNLLNELTDSDIHWLFEPTANLINHIKIRYHNQHRLQLPMLISLAYKVELRNYENPCCPIGLASCLAQLHGDLLVHMEKEEQILFPFLSDKKISYTFVQISLAKHNHDHDIHLINKIDELTNKLSLPQDVDDEWKSFYVELKIFKEDLLEHIRLEDKILFEQCN